jgi:hypothetical protein
MSRKPVFIAIAIGAAWLYGYVLVMAFAYLPTFFLTPGFLHATGHVGGHILLRAAFLTLDLLITIAVSIPFAILIAALYSRWWLLVAVAVACASWLPELVGAQSVWSEVADHTGYVTTLTLTSARLLLTLPLLTYFFQRKASKSFGDRPSAIRSIIP